MNEKKLIMNDKRRKRLRIARDSLGLSRPALGIKCDMTGADIKNRETGVTEIKQIFADALEKNVGIRSKWLMEDKGEMIIAQTDSNDAEKWKDKYIECFEKLEKSREEVVTLRKEIERLSAIPTGAGTLAASSGKKGT